MIKAVIFDCFGVLVGRGFDETYRIAGGNPVRDRVFIREKLAQASRGLISHKDFRLAFANKLGISVSDWQQAVRASDLSNKELLDYANELRKKGYKTAILSNVNSGVLERKIDPGRLGECFDELVASAEVGFIKPDVAIYTHTAEQLGVSPEECVFIDDNVTFVRAAEAVGMHGVVFEDSDHCQHAIDALLAKGKV